MSGAPLGLRALLLTALDLSARVEMRAEPHDVRSL